MDEDEFDLARFVAAQDPVIDQVRAELAAGDKRSHWMWYVFPQIAGLGMSAMSQRYAISGRAEAGAYLRHKLLGARLRDCTALVNGVSGRTAAQIFGGIDAVKFRSCITLFAAVAPDEAMFDAALTKYFGGKRDEATLARL
jgi:uncharacterized protein (DUF1810 family)